MSNDATPEQRLAADLAAAGDDEECTWCARVPGLVLIGAGALLLYIGTDILTGGLLTRLLSGVPAAVTSATTVAADAVPSSVTAGEVVTGDGTAAS